MSQSSTPATNSTQHRPAIFRALRYHNYRVYWFGQIISMTGSWMQMTALAWLILVRTHDARQLGIVSALQYLPALGLSLVGGAFADRWPKRWLLVTTQTLGLLQAASIWGLLVSDRLAIWHIYLLTLGLGIVTSIDQPIRLAFVRDLVAREDVPNAMSFNSSLSSIVRMVGPALAGIIIARGGINTVFFLNALSYVAVIAAVVLLDPRRLFPQATPIQQNIVASIREGWGYIRQSTVSQVVLWTGGFFLLWGANFTVVLPLFATQVLHQNASGYGLLAGALGIGALIGGIILLVFSHPPTVRTLLLEMLLYTALLAAFALSRSFVLCLVLIAAMGAGESILGTQVLTLLPSIAPEQMRGRIISVCILFFTGSAPIGFFLAGWLSSVFGVWQGLLICVVLVLVTIVIGWRWQPQADREVATAS